MSVTDIGSVRWSANVEEVRSFGVLEVTDPLNEAQRDSIEQAVSGETVPGEAFTTSLPTTFRLGAAIELHKVALLQALPVGRVDVRVRLQSRTRGRCGSRDVRRFSLGLEFRPWSFFPLRTGASFGGADHFNFALGFGSSLRRV